MKKALFIIASSLFFSTSAFTQSVQEPDKDGLTSIHADMEQVAIYELPYKSDKNLLKLFTIGQISRNDMPQLSRHAYLDLGGAQYIPWTKHNPCDIYRRFRPGNHNFELLVLETGAAEFRRTILATWKLGIGAIDTLETEIFFYTGNGRFLTQEFSVDTSLSVIVSKLASLEPRPIQAHSDFKTYPAQRVDTHYQIDEHGQFIPIKQIRYKPRKYTHNELINNQNRMLNGDEEPIQETTFQNKKSPEKPCS